MLRFLRHEIRVCVLAAAASLASALDGDNNLGCPLN